MLVSRLHGKLRRPLRMLLPQRFDPSFSSCHSGTVVRQ